MNFTKILKRMSQTRDINHLKIAATSEFSARSGFHAPVLFDMGIASGLHSLPGRFAVVVLAQYDVQGVSKFHQMLPATFEQATIRRVSATPNPGRGRHRALRLTARGLLRQCLGRNHQRPLQGGADTPSGALENVRAIRTIHY